jgi:REP element-mobilizing transposase RayT
MKNYINGFFKTKRHLPHWQLPGREYFVTFELEQPTICDLTDDAIGSIIMEQVDFLDEDRMFLFDITIMPSHVHVIFKIKVNGSQSESLSSIMQSIKGATAYRINKKLGRRGKLWRSESYDRILRDEKEYKKFSKYIFENAVKANLVETGEKWKWWKQKGIVV